MTDRSARSPVWARPAARPTRPALSRELIVRSAIELADRDGLEAVSIRRVAAALDARPMSLYSHVPSKDDLLDLMFDELAGRSLLGADRPEAWEPALRAIAHRVREVGLAHPWSIELLSRRMPLGPNVMRLLEEWIAALDQLRLPPESAWSIVTAVNDYVIREAAQRRAVPANAAQARRWRREVGAYLADLAATGSYPHLAPMLQEGYATAPDNFEVGLDWMIASIRASRRGRAR